MRTPFLLVLAIGLILTALATRAEESLSSARVALVIGNGAYRSAPLKNPVNDARAMARALQGLGFEVQLGENLSQQSFTDALRKFGNRLKETGGVGLFYYAGHGMQVKGSNYLIPVDTAIQTEDEVRYMAIDANQVLDKMEAAGNRLNIVILDACRDNPFARSFRSKQSGLAQMDAPSGTLVAFATAPGAVAYDGDGVNSVYTKHLLHNLALPNLPVELVLKRVREEVARETGQKQMPWESSSLLGDFYFKVESAQTGSSSSQLDPTTVELAFWNSVKDSGVAEEYDAYLKSYPNGRFATLAETRMRSAKSQTARPPPAAATQVAVAEPGGVPQSNRLSVKVGDSWTYGLIDSRKRQVDLVAVSVVGVKGDQIEETVSRVGVRHAGVLRSFRSGFDPEAPFQDAALPGQYSLVEFSPYLFPADAPQVGKEWPKLEREITLNKNPSQRVRMSMTMRVLAKETTQVPAGEFSVVVLQARGKSAAGDEVIFTYWYSPEVRRAVKINRRETAGPAGKGSDESFELVGFHQTK